MDRARTESSCAGARRIARHTAQREGPRNTNNAEESHEEVAAPDLLSSATEAFPNYKNVMLKLLTASLGLELSPLNLVEGSTPISHL
jgi:hypothetical protein